MKLLIPIFFFFVIFTTVAQVKIQSINILSDSTARVIEYPQKGKIVNLNYNQNIININFEDKNHSKNTIYAFKIQNTELQESNKNWIRCSNQRQVNLSYLEGGNYIFYVKNIISKHPPASFYLNIELPFWRKWWFIPSLFLYLMAMVGVIIYLFTLYRFRQQTKLQRVRDNIASDLHDDVGATLSSISFFGEMMRSKIIKNAPIEEVLPLLDKLISTSKETIETMRGVVWTINPNNDNAIDFFQKLQSFGREMLSAKNIDFELFISDFENTKLPLDIQRNFFLFYKEVINNIAKHSEATYVKATIESLEKNAGIAFKIIDNGVGFDTNDIYEGHGLKSLRKRAEELEGTFDTQSAEGKGTSISLSFLLP